MPTGKSTRYTDYKGFLDDVALCAFYQGIPEDYLLIYFIRRVHERGNMDALALVHWWYMSPAKKKLAYHKVLARFHELHGVSNAN